MYCCNCFKITMATKILNKQIRWQSILSAATQSSPTLDIYVCKEDVSDHTALDYLKFYTFPDEKIKGDLTDAVPRQFKDLSKTIRESTILLRKPSLNVISELQELKEGLVPKFILYGPNGGGKTLSLLHIIHHCLQKDWVVLYVPNVFRFVDNQNKSVIQQSQWKDTRVDQPEEAATWLQIFRNMNPNFLADVKTTTEYIWSKREKTEKGQPLMDILQQGIGRGNFSTDAVGILLKEIQQNKKIKVLYAVDAFNGFYGRSSHKLQGKPVGVEDLSLCLHFMKLLQPDKSLNCGAYVMAISQTVHYLKKRVNPRHLDNILPKEALKQLEDYNKVEVPNYTEEEYLNIMKFYSGKRWLSREPTENLLKEISFLTSRNPNMIRTFCASL